MLIPVKQILYYVVGECTAGLLKLNSGNQCGLFPTNNVTKNYKSG